MLKQQIKNLGGQLQRALNDVEIEKTYDQQQLASNQERKTRGKLILENRRLYNEVQWLLKTVGHNAHHELYKSAAYVLASEYAKGRLKLPEE